MVDAPAGALEAALADAGLLLVELDKFRAAGDEPASGLRRETLALGDRARRLHRAATLDDAAGAALLVEARALGERLQDALRDIRAAPAFRAAVAAHRAGDHAALARLLPNLFAGLEHLVESPPLFHPITWLRRNRPRPPADVVADVSRMRDQGVPGHGDAETPGTDPELPALALLTEPSADPILLRFAPEVLPPAVFRHRETREHLVHVPLLRARFEVVVPATLDPDEVGEIPLDHARYRRELLDALGQAALPVRTA